MRKIDEETAREFESRINSALRALFKSLNDVETLISPETHRILAKSIADANYELDLGVLEVIYREYPDLRKDYTPASVTAAEHEGKR